MKWLKKCYYLISLVAVGVVYLSAVDGWQVYAQSIEQIKDMCMGTGSREGRGQMVESGGQGTREIDRWELVESESDTGVEGEEDGSPTPMPSDSVVSVQEPDTADAGDVAKEDGGQDVPAASGGETVQSGQTQWEEPTEKAVPAQPVFVTVEDDYFSDAVFIGDSRTVGLCEYGGLEDISTFYASTGLTVYKIFDSAIAKVPGQKKKITVEEALQANSFAKIYLMIGINEMGTGTVKTFTEKYREVVEHLQELQPGAVIYIQGIIKVTTERSNQGDYINNEGIEARNRELEKLADNKSIFYLDVNPLICDETGGMVDSYTFDGVHLKAKYIQIWKDYLKENAIQMSEPPQ